MKYLILQYPYDFIEIAACNNGKINFSIQESKLTSVKFTIPHIQSMLQEQNISLSDLDFIGVNTGPGPYNTLRALITTVNGIHFSQRTPLINLGALDLLLKESPQPSLAILNAFANHVFYAFSTKSSIEQGYCSIEKLIYKINQHPEQLNLIGNGAKIYQQALLNGTKNIIFPENMSLFNSLQTLAKESYQAYLNKNISHSYLMPKYLQSPAVKK